MAARGLLDYISALGVMMRGIVLNFLIILPHLLLVAILVALSKFSANRLPI